LDKNRERELNVWLGLTVVNAASENGVLSKDKWERSPMLNLPQRKLTAPDILKHFMNNKWRTLASFKLNVTKKNLRNYH